MTSETKTCRKKMSTQFIHGLFIERDATPHENNKSATRLTLRTASGFASEDEFEMCISLAKIVGGNYRGIDAPV